MPTAYVCALCFRPVRPATSPMLRYSWIRFASPANKADLASAAVGCLQTRARCRSLAPVLRPLPDAACDSAANHEAQAQARATSTARSPEMPATKHHRADVWLAEGESQDRHTLRQAGKKFCRHGYTGLHAALPTAVLFVQNLGPDVINCRSCAYLIAGIQYSAGLDQQ